MAEKNTLVRGRASGNFSLDRPQKSVARGVGLSDLIIPDVVMSGNLGTHLVYIFDILCMFIALNTLKTSAIASIEVTSL